MPSGVPLAKRPYVTAKDLANIPVIMPSRQKVFDEVANWFGDYYERLNISEASNLSTNAALLVRAGIGHTFKDFGKGCSGASVQAGLNVRFNEDRQLTSDADILKWAQQIKQ